MRQLKINLYAAQKATAEEFLNFIGNEFNFEYEWLPLNEESIVDDIPHFSIFLLSLQNANSLWLKERVKKLLDVGAHNQSIYFVLMNKEAISKKSDVELVVTDLSKYLSSNLTNPQIDVISLKAFKAFNENEERFIYFDYSLGEHRTIKQLTDGNLDDFQDFQNYHGQAEVVKRLQEWSQNAHLLFWKNSQLTTVVAHNVPKVILDKLQQLIKVQLIEIEKLGDFEILKQDKQVISLQYIDDDLVVEQPVSSNAFVIGKYKSNPHIEYFDEEIYRLKNLPKDKLIQIENLVFLDQKGYPKPKKKIQDWDTEIENISGFTQLMHKIGVKLI